MKTYRLEFLVGVQTRLSLRCEVAEHLEWVSMATLVWIYPVITWKGRGSVTEAQELQKHKGARVADPYVQAAFLNLCWETSLAYRWGALGGGATAPCRCVQGCGTSPVGSATLPLLLSWKRERQTLPPFLGPPSPSPIRWVQPGPAASTHPHPCRILPGPPPQRQRHPPCCSSSFCTPAAGGETSRLLAGPEIGREICLTFL